MTILKEQILHEKILESDVMSDLKIIFSEIQNVEDHIEALLNRKMETSIFDDNDFELKMISLDTDTMNFGNGYEDYEKKLFNEDTRNEIGNYLDLLESLLFHFDYSINLLYHKANDSYKLYFKLKIESVLDELDGDFQTYSTVEQEFYDIRETSKDNPYKILLNTYLYYKNIVFVLFMNIKRNFGRLSEQINLVKAGLQMDISVFENLKKWEDSIEIKDKLSIYDLIEK